MTSRTSTSDVVAAATAVRYVIYPRVDIQKRGGDDSRGGEYGRIVLDHLTVEPAFGAVVS
jgi:hypothetical protein